MMALINIKVDYNKPEKSKLNLVKINHQISFDELDYFIEKTFFGHKWTINIGEIFNSMLIEIGKDDTEESNSSKLHIFDLEVIDFKLAKLTILNNKYRD